MVGGMATLDGNPVSVDDLLPLALTSPFERAAPALENAANSTMKDNDSGFRCITAAP